MELLSVHGPLDPAAATAVRELAASARVHDGVEALGEQTLLNLADPDADVLHVLATGGTGYAQVDRAAGGAELVVHPDARGRGLGAALLAVVREAGTPAVWAHGNLPAARRLAARAGMAVVRELWQMARDLDPAADPTLPSAPNGVVVRPFVVGQDEEAWLRVNARAFAHHPEQGRMTLADLRAREREPWFRAEDLLLAERDGRLLASVWMKVERGSPAGELYVLGVDPDAQGMGLGRLLTARTLAHLTTRGCRRVVLYTEATNTAAVRTYTAAGFVPVRVDVQYG